MVSSAVERELHLHLDGMPITQQRLVLDYARTLSATQGGAKVSSLLSFAGVISTDDLSQMKAAIEADCEVVDANGW